MICLQQIMMAETVILKTVSNALLAADHDDITLLCLLDLSATFDMVDYILFERLHISFGVHRSTLAWTNSFICNQSQMVVFNRQWSIRLALYCGHFSNRSACTDTFSSLHSQHHCNFAEQHGFGAHSYAYDMQLDAYFKPASCHDIWWVCTAQCIKEIVKWMTLNHLHKNIDKLQFIWLGMR